MRRLFASILILAALALPWRAHADDSTVNSIATQISAPASCWSCQLYGVVYNGMHVLVQSSYASFVSGSSSGAVAFGLTILAIVLIVKMLPILIGSAEHHQSVSHIRLFLFRVFVVGLLLLSTAATTVVANDGILSDWLIDGPLAIGTALGGDLANAAVNGLGSAFGGGLGAGTSMFSGYTDPNAVATPAGASFGVGHVLAAQGMLYHLHLLGCVGIITGVWIAIANPQINILHPINSAILIVAGAFLAFVFFRFTVFFGLRYIDALIRSMVIFALLPLFLFLWIFDGTRQIAIQALRAGLSLAAVFAVSGVVFTAAYFIMYLAFQNVFANQGMAFAGLTSVLQSIGQGQFANLIGQAGQGDGSINWLGYFYLLGAGSMATACADLAFKLSEQLFDFGASGMNIAEGVREDMGTAGSMAMSAGQSVLR